MDEFMENLLLTCASHCPLPLEPDVGFSNDGSLVIRIAGVCRTLPVPELFPQYERLRPADRPKFLRHVFLEYVIKGEAAKIFGPHGAGVFEEKKKHLLPFLAPEGWLKEKSVALPPGVQIPSLTLSGQDGAADGIAVCLVIDPGHDCSLVISSHLTAWGFDIRSAMPIAIQNLLARTPTANNWVLLSSGCVMSKWCDNYDSTRVALLPHLAGEDVRQLLTVELHKPAVDSEEQMQSLESYDIVVAFATHNQTFVGGSNNAQSLCFMGQMLLDLLSLQRVGIISLAPFRLMANDSDASAGLLGLPDLPGSRWRWVPYVPAKDEFCVPRSEEEINAIMVGAHCGRAPVFRHALPPSEAPAGGQASSSSCGAADTAEHTHSNEAAERERELGNACFKAKRWEEALQHYSAAVDLSPAALQYVPLCNRAAVWLELGRPTDAMADCDEVLRQHSRHPKALYRRGCAYQALHNYDLALADFEMLRETDPGSQKAAAAQVSKTMQLQMQWQVMEWTSQVIGIMLEPKGCDTMPSLLTKAVGWSAKCSASGSPGWMPLAMSDSILARVAALELYSMLRNEWITSRDVEAGSAYTLLPDMPLAPKAPWCEQAASEFMALCGVHSFIILGIINRHLFSQWDPYEVPAEKRSLTQIIACILLLPEMQLLLACSFETLRHAGVLPQLLEYTPGQYRSL